MTNATNSRRTDIADLFAEETGQPSRSFAVAFTETVDGFRMTCGDDPVTAGLPDAWEAERASEMMVQTLFDVMRDTRLEDIAARLAWGVVHAFHKVAKQLDDEADRAAMQVKDLIRSADGSEVGTVELEEAQQQCQSLDEASEAVACMRDRAADTFRLETGRPWSAPRATLVSGKRTASVVDGTNFLAARRQRRIDAHAPQGPVVLFSGGQKWHDHQQLWDRLDQIGSALVNGQNYYTAITRARFGVKLWTEDPKTLAEKLERNPGEKTSSLEGLGRLDNDGHRAVAQRHPDQLREGRAEQERWREERRERTLMRRLGRRPAPPNGIAEQLAEGAREIAVRLDRFLQAVLDRERTPDREGSEAPAHTPAAPSHSPGHAAPQRGPER